VTPARAVWLHGGIAPPGTSDCIARPAGARVRRACTRSATWTRGPECSPARRTAASRRKTSQHTSSKLRGHPGTRRHLLSVCKAAGLIGAQHIADHSRIRRIRRVQVGVTEVDAGSGRSSPGRAEQVAFPSSSPGLSCAHTSAPPAGTRRTAHGRKSKTADISSLTGDLHVACRGPPGFRRTGAIVDTRTHQRTCLSAVARFLQTPRNSPFAREKLSLAAASDDNVQARYLQKRAFDSRARMSTSTSRGNAIRAHAKSAGYEGQACVAHD
jgi:hypothetical protein